MSRQEYQTEVEKEIGRTKDEMQVPPKTFRFQTEERQAEGEDPGSERAVRSVIR